jgi:hypothetical protein
VAKVTVWSEADPEHPAVYEPQFEDAPMIHHYSPDLQRDGRTCVVCGLMPGGQWHYKAVE